MTPLEQFYNSTAVYTALFIIALCLLMLLFDREKKRDKQKKRDPKD